MDFISSDRSGDSEWKQGLQNYNTMVHDKNRQITKDKGTAKDTELGQEGGIDQTEDITQIGGAISEAGAVGQLATTLDKISNLSTETPTIVPPKPAPKAPVEAPSESAPQGILSGEAEEGGGSLSSPEDADNVISSGTEATTDIADVGKVGSTVSTASKAVKGLGVIGAVGSLGMDIASDTGGGWKAKSTADKIGNVAGITGAGLDIVGAGLEATGFGAPIGLGLQAIGTLFQIGSGIEGEITSSSDAKQAKIKAKAEEQAKDDAEDAPSQQVQGVSLAQTGGLGVARQQQ